MNKEQKQPPFSFEKAYARLEEILETFNSGEVSLETSLKLYEEGDSLIALCTQKLNSAEQKIQVLVKNRKGELPLDEEGHPQVEQFNAQAEDVLTRRFDSSYDNHP